jgi:hypothetical protein
MPHLMGTPALLARFPGLSQIEPDPSVFVGVVTNTAAAVASNNRIESFECESKLGPLRC